MAADRFRSFVIVAPDTDQGKTTFAAAFLHAAISNGLEPRYWKPVQSGEPDTETVRRRVEGIGVQFEAAVRSYEPAIAPHVAARLAGDPPLTVTELLAAAPDGFGDRENLVVETFGGPLSPLDEGVPQASLLTAFGLPVVVVAKNRVGAINMCSTAVEVLRARGIEVLAAVLVGGSVDGNRRAVAQQNGVPVFEMPWPSDDTASSFAEASVALRDLVSLVRVAEPSPEATEAFDQELRRLDHEVTWHPYTPLESDEERPIIRRAYGEWLELDQHRGGMAETIVDGISSWWTCVHGHGEPTIRAALGEAARDLDHVLFAGMAHEPAVRFAAELLEFLPDAFERTFFSDSGSTANEVALKVLLGGWRRMDASLEPEERTLIVCLEGGYHGDTFGTMAIGRDPVFFAEFDPMLFDTVQIPMTLEALEGAIAEHGTRLGGVILEPLVQGACGMKMHAPEDVRAFADRARSEGLPVIFDEVMTGFGRSGSMFAFERVGFVPDVITLGKGLSGGVLPLAGTVVNQRWCDPWRSPDRARMLFHGHSFTANPLACATGRAGLRLFGDGTALEGAQRLEESFRSLAAEAWPERVHSVRSSGAIFAFDLREEADAGGYLSSRREAVLRVAREEGVLLRPLGNVVYAMPPLCTGPVAFDRIRSALRRISNEC